MCTAFVRCAPLLCCAAFAGPAVDGQDVARNQPPPAELGAVPSCWRALGAGLSCREVAPAHQLRPPVATVDDVRTAPRSSSPPRRRWRLHHHRLSMTASRQGSAAAQAAPARATAPAGAVVRRRVPRSKAPTAKAATKPVASPMEAALAGLHRARPGSAFHTPDRHADGLAPAACLTAPPVPVPPTAIPRAPASAPSSTTPTPPPVPLAVPHPPPLFPCLRRLPVLKRHYPLLLHLCLRRILGLLLSLLPRRRVSDVRLPRRPRHRAPAQPRHRPLTEVWQREVQLVSREPPSGRTWPRV